MQTWKHNMEYTAHVQLKTEYNIKTMLNGRLYKTSRVTKLNN